MELGPEGWEQSMAEVDRIKLSFPEYEDDEEEGGDEDGGDKADEQK